MRRLEWERRLDMVIGVFVPVFVGAIAVALAFWMLAAVTLGTIELVRRFA